jgi:DNA (cytosine-5)-methyltransferase 1
MSLFDTPPLGELPPLEPGAPSAIEVCYNIGGAGLGVRRAGFTERLLNVEVDPLRVEIARANGHDVMLADIADIAWADYAGATLVTGGPPCQPFVKGQFGKDLREYDPRDCLPLMLDVVAEVRPTFVVIENIAQLAGAKNVGYVNHIYERIVDLGYDAEWDVIDCADYGTPQHRRRWVLLAAEAGTPITWAEPMFGPGRPFPHRTVADAFGWTPGWCHFCEVELDACAMHGERARREAAERLPKDVAPGQVWPGIVFDHEPWEWERPALTIMGRPLLNAPGTRANAGNGALRGQNDGVRCTLAEMARIQGLPADYNLAGPKSAVAKAIGQVFPPQAAEAIIRELVRPVLGDSIAPALEAGSVL